MGQGFFAYIRVSTIKQGVQGVSLQEQKSAIERYAHSQNIRIIQWFEERETAAKCGRPVFNQMLSLLKKSKAEGVVIHKIDRSARNLRDWSDLGELIDRGVSVHFANESLDLGSRGGRLSADLQAVIASDFIRNLKEESRKGFYGRIKQGLYPLPAPIGYLDQGRGKMKIVDPIKGPMVKRAFEMYASGKWSTSRLAQEMTRRGLRNHRGGRISKNGVGWILRNPFYIGLIRLKSTGEMFEGVHAPLITKSLFDKVQGIITGKTVLGSTKHDYLFRKMLLCNLCKRKLIGERQKGHVYYRCQTKECPTKTLREETVEEEIERILSKIHLTKSELNLAVSNLRSAELDRAQARRVELKSLQLQLNKINERQNRLTDLLIDGVLAEEDYLKKKNALICEKRSIKENMTTVESGRNEKTESSCKNLELAHMALLSYENATTDEKREMLNIVISNLLVSGKILSFKLNVPFEEIWNQSSKDKN